MQQTQTYTNREALVYGLLALTRSVAPFWARTVTETLCLRGCRFWSLLSLLLFISLFTSNKGSFIYVGPFT